MIFLDMFSGESFSNFIFSSDREQKIIKAAKTKKKIKKISVISAAAICIVVALTIIINSIILPSVKYAKAVELMDAGKFNDAYKIFT